MHESATEGANIDTPRSFFDYVSRAVFDGLDDVAWAKYAHAYGPADDIPDLLRALASADEGARARAQFELYGTLWNQGKVYEATQHAIPFLVALLEEAEHVDRPWLLAYLSALAHGNSHHEVHQDIGLYESERDTPEFHAKIHRELLWVAEAEHAVRRGVPTYRTLLEHPDATTRAAAAFLLGGLRQDAPATIPLLAARLGTEEDAVARASLAEALGALGDEPLTRVRLAKLIDNDPEPYVRWAAACTLAYIAGADAPDNVGPALLDAMQEPSLEEAHGQSPWAEDNTPGATARALLALGPGKGVAGLGLLVELLGQADPSSALTICEALLGLAFSPPPSEEPTWDELTAVQQEILKTLAYNDSAWTMGSNMGAMLSRLELPSDADALQAYAGLATRRVGGDTMESASPGESMAGAPIPDEW